MKPLVSFVFSSLNPFSLHRTFVGCKHTEKNSTGFMRAKEAWRGVWKMASFSSMPCGLKRFSLEMYMYILYARMCTSDDCRFIWYSSTVLGRLLEKKLKKTITFLVWLHDGMLRLYEQRKFREWYMQGWSFLGKLQKCFICHSCEIGSVPSLWPFTDGLIPL